MAVAVVVEPDGVQRPARVGEAGLLRHLAEGAVAVVVVELRPLVRQHDQVDEAVVVVVGGRAAEGEVAAGDARLLRDVLELEVALVAVERVAELVDQVAATVVADRLLPATLREVDVELAVVVEVEDAGARAGALDDVAEAVVAEAALPGDAGLGR